MSIKNTIKKILPLIDRALLVPLAISASVFKIFMKVGSHNLPVCRKLLKSTGIYPIRDHYYQPLFNDSRLTKSLREPRQLPGIDWNIEQQILLLNNLVYASELIDLKLDDKSADPLEFSFNNGNFESGDAEFLYQMIRHLKPQKIIEIGSGNSTKIAHKAVIRNYVETGIRAVHTCIEPYEMPWLDDLCVDTIRMLVEQCDINMFEELGENDLLFIDSSHIIRPQGDVLAEYLEIIPRLRSGVVVHIHDIFTPRDYLDEWVVEKVLFWNEQYLLEVLLGNTARYEVLAAINYLRHSNYDLLKRVCPYLDECREPGSFYFRVR
jgi:predicted O-methyltransferase YrrM